MEQLPFKSNGSHSQCKFSKTIQLRLDKVPELLFTNKKKKRVIDNSNSYDLSPPCGLEIPSQRISTTRTLTHSLASHPKLHPTNPVRIRETVLAREAKGTTLRNLKSRCLNKLKHSWERPPTIEPKRLATDLPGGDRQEVSNLIEWFSTMKTTYLVPAIYKNELFGKPAGERLKEIENIENVFKLGVGEIVRQVSVSCNKRGKLLSDFFEFYQNFLRMLNKLEQQHLFKKISALQHQLEVTTRTSHCAQSGLVSELDSLKEQVNENSVILTGKTEEIQVLRKTVATLERERFLMNRNGTTQRVTPAKRVLRPVFSSSQNLQEETLLASFFTSQWVQADIPLSRTDKSTFTEHDSVSHSTQTDDNEEHSPPIEKDPTELPSAIIVTTETDESFIEYAFLPNQSLLLHPHMRQVNRTGGFPVAQRIQRKSTGVPAAPSSSGLLVPAHFTVNEEEIKQHLPNPDPFTSKVPLKPKITKHAAQGPQTVKTTQTERDLLLETEESEILEAMINYKREILRSAEQELVLAKSKLAGVARHRTSNSRYPPEPPICPSEATVSAERPTETEKDTLRKSFTVVKMQEKKGRHPSSLVIKKILKRQIYIEKYNSLTKKLILRKLSFLYISAVSRGNSGETLPPLAEFAYDFIQAKHQETLIGEKKFTELIVSALKNADSPDIVNFLRLVGVAEHIDLGNFARPASAFRFYINLLGLLTRSTLGLVHDTGETVYLPKIRAIECMKDVFSHLFTQEHVALLCAQIEVASKTDPLKINAGGVVSQHFVLDSALNEYEKHSRGVTEAVGLISQGFDLENTGTIHSSEFLMVLQQLYPAKPPTLLPALSNSRGFITVEALTEFCLQNSILSINPINELLKGIPISEINVKDYIKSLLLRNLCLMNNVTSYRKELGISEEIEALWKDKIRSLDHSLSVRGKPLYFAFTVFVKELQRLNSLIK